MERRAANDERIAASKERDEARKEREQGQRRLADTHREQECIVSENLATKSGRAKTEGYFGMAVPRIILWTARGPAS